MTVISGCAVRDPMAEYSRFVRREIGLENFVTRRLGGSDVSAYRQIRLQALRERPEAFGAAWEEEQALPESRFVERLEHGHVIGSFSDMGTLVGTIGIARSQGQKTRHIGSIWGMYVQPPARGKGLARLLLNIALKEVGTSLRSLRLSVESNNLPAIRLYEFVGFTTWALEKEALKIGDVFHDEMLMRLDLR
jgi:ribosomal protein S18 acetylase RimI-like enzyme